MGTHYIEGTIAGEMKELTKRDRDVLMLLSEGQPDSLVCRKLGLRSDQLDDCLNRIRVRAESHPEASAAQYYERALRKRAENHARSLQARFNALLGASSEAILVVNGRTGVIAQANENSVRVFGYPMTELIGMSVEKLIPDELRAIHPAYRIGFLASARKREMGYHPPIFAVRKDGTQLEMAIALTSSGTDDDVMVVCSEFATWSALSMERREPGRTTN